MRASDFGMEDIKALIREAQVGQRKGWRERVGINLTVTFLGEQVDWIIKADISRARSN